LTFSKRWSIIKADSNSEEGNMEKYLPNFPLLFDKIGGFLVAFNKLRETRLKLSPADFAEEFDKLVNPRSPSSADEALAAFNEIVDTVYYDRASGGCLGGSTKIRG
jgi:hypothetical protein